jgi:hypothetical protein
VYQNAVTHTLRLQLCEALFKSAWMAQGLAHSVACPAPCNVAVCASPSLTARVKPRASVPSSALGQDTACTGADAAAERRHPTGRESMDSSTLHTLQDPIAAALA